MTDASAELDAVAIDPKLQTHNKPLIGVAFVVLATLLFAYSDTANKFLIATYDVPLVAAVRYIVHAILMLAIFAPRRGRQLIDTTRTGLVIARALCLVVGTMCAGFALQRLPIAEAISIIYLAPIAVVILAGPILGERIGVWGWAAAVGGFIGVVLIARPGGGLDPIGVLFALGNVVVSVGYYLLSRVLVKTERTLALLFYAALVGAILFGLATPWFWFGKVPTLIEAALFISLGVSAALGHYCFTASYRYAEASLLAPMGYVHLIWAGILGWLVFNQVPDALGLLGMGVILVAGVIVAIRTRLESR